MVINAIKQQNIISVLISVLAINAAISIDSYAQQNRNNKSPVTILNPEKQVKKVDYAAIDTEKFEAGIFAGVLSVEDFSSSKMMGASLSYHVTEQFIAQVNYGRSDVGDAAFEEALGKRFLSDNDKAFTYINAMAGYRVFRGRSFLGAAYKFNSGFYLLAGPERVSFAGDKHTALVLGASYKIVVNDWMTCNIDLRDHVFKRDFLSDEKTTQNIELAIGLNVLF